MSWALTAAREILPPRRGSSIVPSFALLPFPSACSRKFILMVQTLYPARGNGSILTPAPPYIDNRWPIDRGIFSAPANSGGDFPHQRGRGVYATPFETRSHRHDKENIEPLHQPSAPETSRGDAAATLTLNVPRAIDLNRVATRRGSTTFSARRRFQQRLIGAFIRCAQSKISRSPVSRLRERYFPELIAPCPPLSRAAASRAQPAAQAIGPGERRMPHRPTPAISLRQRRGADLGLNLVGRCGAGRGPAPRQYETPNEVVANLALELLGHRRGGVPVFWHPIDDRQHAQSTNDAYPTALRLAVIFAARPLRRPCESLPMHSRPRQLNSPTCSRSAAPIADAVR